MKTSLIETYRLIFLAVFLLLVSACESESSGANSQSADNDARAADYRRGPHGGRLLVSGEFALELAIYETGMPPEFRAWATFADQPLSPQNFSLEIQLTRLGDVVDQIRFKPQDDYLRGDQVVREPHSFVVSINAKTGDRTFHWEYNNIEGRTRISAAVAAAFGLETEIAGPAVIHETIQVYGRIEPNADRVSTVSARFDGLIESVSASLGDRVVAGQPLLTIESNESLKSYVIKAPISGTITERNANPGEPTSGRHLFTIIDPSTVWVRLAVFPADLQSVHVGTPVTVFSPSGGEPVMGAIDHMNILADDNQAVMAQVVLDNKAGQFFPGNYVRAQVHVAEHSVPLAVKRNGLQNFRDFTVVYAQIGDEYEVRMLELGRQDDEWIEVLEGLIPGTAYVTANSYLVKADIEKSGASHDH